jgi:hypothetical protein
MSDNKDMLKAMLPEVKFNKNGYEIRTEVLKMANETVWQDYYAKWGQFEQTVTRDPETGTVVSKTTFPEVPGVESVLEAAEKFYTFVNQK